MNKALKEAAVEGFTGSFVLAATIIKVVVGGVLSVLSAFAHNGQSRHSQEGHLDG